MTTVPPGFETGIARHHQPASVLGAVKGSPCARAATGMSGRDDGLELKQKNQISQNRVAELDARNSDSNPAGAATLAW